MFSKYCYSLIWICCVVISGCNHPKKNTSAIPLHPEPIGFDEEEISKMRAKYIELVHTAPPGVDWRKIEAFNVEQNIRIKNIKRQFKSKNASVLESFANGKVQATWNERGSNNQTGSIIASDYDSVNNQLYVISSGGSIWRNTGLVTDNWTLINDNYIFDNSLIKVINKTSGGIRIFAKINNQLSYSDDNAGSFNPVSITFPVAWGPNGPTQFIVLKSSGNIIYLLCYIWDDVSWSPRLSLYRSTNEGTSFGRFYTFNHGDLNAAKILNPYNSNAIYVMDCSSSAGKINLSQINGTTVSLLNSVAQPQAIGYNPQFAGILTASGFTFYLMNDNKNIFTSTDNGATWPLKGTLPQNSWDRLDVSNTDPQKLYTGGVEAMRSYNGGSSWTVVNNWYDYYGNIAGKLHADIMSITQYRKSNGIPFMIVNSHGGVATSYDFLTTTQNLSVNGLHSAQYYDILTALDNPNIIYGGTQDQGIHKTTTALSPGLLNFNQVISGDYGYLTIADIYKTFYAEYPGGNLYIFDHTNGSYLKTWTMPGTQKPNYGWMLPIKNTYNSLSDTILMAGGNLTGDSGSYLCKINMQSISPYTISSSQYNFNFRANSNNRVSGITAIETCPLQQERMYVATEDGSFFYTADAGNTWNKSSTFSVGGGWYLYGATILSSRLTKNLVWYGGSGYGGSSAFKSTNGGQTFTPMNNGLPQTLVHEMVANLSESMLFAATDAGPYVYIVAEDQWYPLIGADNPIQAYTAVEFLSATNTARFATYGRGIFDFNISEPVIYYFFGDGNWNDPTKWVNQLMPPVNLSGNHEIFISPYGECLLNISQTIRNGAKITIAEGKKLTITGSLTQK